jgi:hypothetical protein
MSSGAGDLDRPLRRLLAAYIFEVHEELLLLAQQRISIRFDRSDAIPGIHKVDYIEQ